MDCTRCRAVCAHAERGLIFGALRPRPRSGRQPDSEFMPPAFRGTKAWLKRRSAPVPARNMFARRALFDAVAGFDERRVREQSFAAARFDLCCASGFAVVRDPDNRWCTGACARRRTAVASVSFATTGLARAVLSKHACAHSSPGVDSPPRLRSRIAMGHHGPARLRGTSLLRASGKLGRQLHQRRHDGPRRQLAVLRFVADRARRVHRVDNSTGSLTSRSTTQRAC